MTYLATIRETIVEFHHADATIDVVKPKRVIFTETSDEMIGPWGMELHNPRSRIASKIKSADTVEVWLKKDAETTFTRVYSGVVTRIGRTFTHGKRSEFDVEGLHIEAILQRRHVTRTVRKGTDYGALIHEVFAGNDLGITLTGVANPFGATVPETFVLQHVDLREFMTRIAALASAGWHLDANKALHFYALGAANSGITDDGSKGWGYQFGEDVEQVVNVVRGFGGENKVVREQQTTQGAFERVTTSAELKKQMRWPREEMPFVEIFCRAVAGSAASVEVRLEADDGANAPSGFVLTRAYIDPAELPASGGAGAYEISFLPAHVIAPGGLVWLIVAATTDDGVDVGVDNGTNKNLTFKAYVGVPVASEKKDQPSIDAYGRREGRPIRDPDVTSLDELNARLDVVLAKFKDPLYTGTFYARDPAYLTATLGQYVTFNIPEIDPNLNGKQLVLKERVHEWANAQYRLHVTVADGEREREVGEVVAALIRRLEAIEHAALPGDKSALQLVVGSDSLSLTDSASLTTQATGTFLVDVAKVDLSDVA